MLVHFSVYLYSYFPYLLDFVGSSILDFLGIWVLGLRPKRCRNPPFQCLNTTTSQCLMSGGSAVKLRRSPGELFTLFNIWGRDVSAWFCSVTSLHAWMEVCLCARSLWWRSKVAFAKTPPPQPTDAPVKEVGLCQLVEFGAPKCGELAGHTFQGLLGR